MRHHPLFCHIHVIFILVLSICTCYTPVLAADTGNPSSDTGDSVPDISLPFQDILDHPEDGPVLIHYFFNPGCSACEKIAPFIRSYQVNHSEVRIHYYSLAGNKTNIELFTQFQNEYNLSHAYVPILFLGNTSLMGGTAISEDLDKTVQMITEKKKKTGLIPGFFSDIRTVTQNSSINPALLLIAAIGEGLNPCGLLVLALLLVSLMASESRRTVLLVGLAYIAAFYVVRLLSGFAIFTVIQLPGLSQTFTLIAAGVALVAGAIQIKDGLSREEHPLLSIPASKKGLVSSYMKKASIPAGLIVGVLVGIYGMACTAGIYITILGMLYKEPVVGLIYLVLYNVVVIIPLLIILGLVFFGIPPEKVNSWRKEQKSMLRVIIGVLMIIMAIIILIPLL